MNTGLFYQILRIRLAARLLPRKEQETGCVLRQPTFPNRLFCTFIFPTAIHAISSSQASPGMIFV